LRMRKAGIACLSALIPIITVAYSLLLGWIAFGLERLFEAVTTMLGQIWPIIKPVLLKFHVSLF
jgi:hypothetical protein